MVNDHARLAELAMPQSLPRTRTSWRENTPGVQSPRKIGDVRLDVLTTSIIETWNVRYGANMQTQDFEQLFVP